MKQQLSIVLVFLAVLGCGDGEEDRLVGTWVARGQQSSEVTEFRKNGTVLHVNALGDSLEGTYLLVNDRTVKLDLVHDGDSLAYLWNFDLRQDSMLVAVPGGLTMVLERAP